VHDPSTVAWEIRAPWFRRDKHFRNGRYHPALVTIWHVDPETDGTDDDVQVVDPLGSLLFPMTDPKWKHRWERTASVFASIRAGVGG
jgi:hypothetical protein